jgi:menaquinol-cytochrome c reductase iron-sulfur subunit
MSTPTIPERRGFLAKMFALVGGGVALLAPAALGFAAFLNPLRQKGQSGVFDVAKLDALPEDGSPVRFPIVGERIDAWSRSPRQPIGAVYLRRIRPADGSDKVEALQVVCPHAGCMINFESSAEGGKFFCPCHRASFDLAGKRADVVSPSPRDMDSLDTKILDDGTIQVKFQTFVSGTAGKKAQA